MPTTTRDQDDAIERYAQLNRAAERGDATPATRHELIRVCIELDKRDEAVAAFSSIEDPSLRHAFRPELARLGWVRSEYDADELRACTVTDANLTPSVREKFEDALQFLCEGRMRIYVLGGTMAFPVVLGAGGVLASGTDSLPLRLIALLPALLVVGTVGALARQVLSLTIRGHDDATELPDLSELIRESWILVDFVALSAVFFGPAAVMAWLGAPPLVLVLLGVAALFMPLTTALRMTGTGWRYLTPRRVLAAVGRLSPSYPAVAGAIALLLAPAVLVLFLTAGMHVFVMLSVSGPLAVAPVLMSARMLGLTLHYQRDRLNGLFMLPRDPDRVVPGS